MKFNSQAISRKGLYNMCKKVDHDQNNLKSYSHFKHPTPSANPSPVNPS